MPKPSWETGNNPAFFGHLKFLDFQTTRGLDVHVTFQKDKKVHVSVYELGGKKVGGNTWMEVEAYGLSLNFMDWYVLRSKICGSGGSFPAVKGYKDYEEFFLSESNNKAVELGIVALKPGMVIVAQAKYDLQDQSQFPGLG